MGALYVIPVTAQQIQKKNVYLAPVKTDSVYFLGDWVVSSSLSVVSKENTVIPLKAWNFDSASGSLRLLAIPEFDFSAIDTLAVYFEEQILNLQRLYPPLNYQLFDSSAIILKRDSLAQTIFREQSSGVFSETNLTQRGSLSRGIVVGTNQDFSMESGLNFELSGTLTENLSIEAALTDRNIPIQPDGTTQNLREFDRVFIQLKSPETRLQMGDVDVKFEKSNFAKLNRRLQGAAGYNTSVLEDFGAAVSVVRGMYHRMNFSGMDGVQGPYRLRGDANEQFVTILAGTERVYINGVQVQRGEENEYIIDYGLGEITFTNNLLIRDETRIVVEYEYINQNFSRTLVAGEGMDHLFDGKLRLGATVIRQADGHDLLSQRILTESDIQILKNAGDNLDNAMVSGAEVFDETDRDNNVRYAARDTVFAGTLYEIYVNEPGAADAKYKVRFSNVGRGKGSYIRSGSSINGIVFKWAGPEKGDYEPFRKLPAPEKQQMAAFNGVYRFSENISVFGEWAVSDFDKNRFSSLDKEDNVDFAYLAGIELNNIPLNIGEFSTSFKRRHSGQNFQYFERTKDVEFDRKWNLNSFLDSEETINELAGGLKFSENSQFNAEYGFVERNGLKSRREAAQLSLSDGEGLQFEYNQDLVLSSDGVRGQNGNWFRQNTTFSKVWSANNIKITPYIYAEQERRLERSMATDSLSKESFLFYDVGPGLAFTAEKLHLDYSVGYRSEAGVLEEKLRKQTHALAQKLDIDLTPSSNFSNKNSFQLRTKETDSRFASPLDELKRHSFLMRSLTTYSNAADTWNGDFLYEANTRQQALFQESYLEVGPELGQYVWDDLNGDGIQQVDEFFPELGPNEGTFIRLLIPSDELFRVVELNTRLRNEFQPFSFLDAETETSRFFRQIRIKSGITIRENSTTQKLSDVYLLNLKTFRNDSTTITGSLSFEKELDLLPDYDFADLTFRYNQMRSQNRRSNEVLSVYNDALTINGSIRISERTDAVIIVSKGVNRSLSSTLHSRNYEISSFSLEPGLNSTLNRSWRTGLKIALTNKKDLYPDRPVNAKLFKIRNENRLFLFRKIQANTTIEFRKTLLSGSTSGIGMFELTDGTGPGTGLLWNLNSNYRVNDLIRLSLTYDGRKLENMPAVNTFKIIVNAIF